MTLCARCGKPIKGKPLNITADSATGAAEVLIHREYCKATPRQTYPARTKR
ncbi:hypothetical protein AB0D47_26705 [Streptomyces sp. NPDC048376]|uniref:hypothetical protein n=1 Tax=Streptomyces sp. NPDC048376 TaxID=3154926 RepID=UPI00341F864E